MFLHLSSQKSKEKLFWESKLSIKESLSWTVEWYNNCSINKESVLSNTLMQIEHYAALWKQKDRIIND